MARDGDFGFAMATPGLKASIKPAHMSVVTAPGIEHGTISRLDEGPLQIHIDIAAHRAKADFPAAGILRATNPQ